MLCNMSHRVAIILSIYRHMNIDTLHEIATITKLHRLATLIQTCFRGYRCRQYFKHRFVRNWGQLMRLVDPENLYTIEPYELVRQEWKNDIDAWIFSMKQPNSKQTFEEIEKECINGEWGEKKIYKH